MQENVSSSEDISARTKSVIELKKLQLLELQRRLRRLLIIFFRHQVFKFKLFLLPFKKEEDCFSLIYTEKHIYRDMCACISCTLHYFQPLN